MTNLTKQEIQELTGLLKEGFIGIHTENTKKDCRVLKTLQQALDIAEKQVWLPISEAPKDGTVIEVLLRHNGNGQYVSFPVVWDSRELGWFSWEADEVIIYDDEVESYRIQTLPSIAGSTLSDVAKKAGKSASDKVKLSKRV